MVLLFPQTGFYVYFMSSIAHLVCKKKWDIEHLGNSWRGDIVSVTNMEILETLKK